MNKIIIALLFVLLGFSSCMTQKPKHMGLKDYNKNNVKAVQRPHYKKKLTLVGKGTQAGAVLGGVVGAITVQPTTVYDVNNEKTTNNEANVVIGASVGYGVTSLYYTLKGQGKKTYIGSGNDFYEWLSKYNRKKRKNYVYTGFTANYAYLVLPNDAKTERNYVVNSLDDAIMFKNVFPRSSRMNEIEYQAYMSLRNYNEALAFINSFPNSKYAIHLKKKIEEEKAACARKKTDPSSISLENIVLVGSTAWCFFYKDDYPNFCRFVSCYLQYKIGKADEKSIFSKPFAAAAAVELVIVPFVESKKNSGNGSKDFFADITDKSGKIIRSGTTDALLVNPLKKELEKRGYKEIGEIYDLYLLIDCIRSK
jgi:hypothetical protein